MFDFKHYILYSLCNGHIMGFENLFIKFGTLRPNLIKKYNFFFTEKRIKESFKLISHIYLFFGDPFEWK